MSSADINGTKRDVNCDHSEKYNFMFNVLNISAISTPVSIFCYPNPRKVIRQSDETNIFKYKLCNWIVKISKTVGPEGGIIYHSHGEIMMFIPTGALDTNVNFSLYCTKPMEEDEVFGELAIGPPNLRFLKPVSVFIKHGLEKVTAGDMLFFTREKIFVRDEDKKRQCASNISEVGVTADAYFFKIQDTIIPKCHSIEKKYTTIESIVLDSLFKKPGPYCSWPTLKMTGPICNMKSET